MTKTVPNNFVEREPKSCAFRFPPPRLGSGRTSRQTLAAMSAEISPQEKMDAAFVNYFQLSRILQQDLEALLDGEKDTQHCRRNFIRASVAHVEGYVHCLREMCAVSFECEAPIITNKEAQVLQSERGVDANERIKLTLRIAYKLFELSPAPNFGGQEWPRAQRVLNKRHLLMHPKTPSDLEVPDSLWNELRQDVTWLMEQLFNFFSLLQEKYGC